MKPFIGIKKIWYGAVITAAVTPASLKTWLGTATEVKNSHQDTWGYTEDDPTTTDYINELTGKVYYKDVTAKGARTMAFTMGEYSFEDKKELQGGELVKDGQAVVGWHEPDVAEVINKAIVGQTKTGNYIVFTDLPNNVYYAYNASAIGDAFLHFRNGYPNSKLFHRLADAPLIINDKGRCYENEAASSVATYIDQMSKKKSNEARAKKKWGKKAAKKVSKGRTYTFYHHGNTMKLVIYDEYFTVTNMNGKTIWYHAEKAAIAKMKDIFKEAYQKQKAEQTAQKETEVSGSTAPDQTDSTSESDASSTHRNEMESEGTTE